MRPMSNLRIVSVLAWRNLWRNYRRTAIMIAAITVGVWAMIFMTAMMRGMVDSMIEDGLSALPGHVQVHRPGFLDDPSITNLIDIADADIEQMFDAAGVAGWASRVKVPAVITSERDSRGVTVFGIDPRRERNISFVAGDLSAGRFLDDESDNGIVIGALLAEKLDTGPGKRVVLMSQGPGNEVVDLGFRVVGLFASELDSYEETMAFVGKHALQRMLKIGDRVSEIVVQADDYRNVGPLAEQVSALVGPTQEVLPWMQLNTYLGRTLEVMDGFVLISMVVIFLVLSFGLVNTLVMAVYERIREIGLMMALGMRPSSILEQVLVESLLLLVLGLIAGDLIAVASIELLSDGIDVSVVAEGMQMMGVASVLYPKLQTSDILLANAVVLVLGFLASLSPAWSASRYDPIEALAKT